MWALRIAECRDKEHAQEELLADADFNDVLEIQAQLVVEHDVHQSGSIKHNIRKLAYVMSIVNSDDIDFVADPLPQIDKFLSRLLGHTASSCARVPGTYPALL
jgi:hypothetical protein